MKHPCAHRIYQWLVSMQIPRNFALPSITVVHPIITLESQCLFQLMHPELEMATVR
jgi:hypothetical protein